MAELISRISSCQSSLSKYGDDLKNLSDYLIQHRQDIVASSLFQLRDPFTELISLHKDSTSELDRISEDTGMFVT